MHYNVIKRTKIGDKETAIYYATAISTGESTIDQIAAKIEARCTVTRPDILAVLAAFVDDIQERLASGLIVRLGELGSMQLGLKGKAVEALKDFSIAKIKGPRVLFRPGARLQALMNTVTFKRIYNSASAMPEEQP